PPCVLRCPFRPPLCPLSRRCRSESERSESHRAQLPVYRISDWKGLFFARPAGQGLGLTDGPATRRRCGGSSRKGGHERVGWWDQGHFTAPAKRLRAEPRGSHPNGDLTDSFVPSDGRAVSPTERPDAARP